MISTINPLWAARDTPLLGPANQQHHSSLKEHQTARPQHLWLHPRSKQPTAL